MADTRGPLAGRHVLLGVSGGIAAYKAASLARALIKDGATVQAILTPSAARFIGPATFEGLTGRAAPTETFTDVHDVLHVRLAREADITVVAPATANIIAKMATGISDDLLTSALLCVTGPVIVAPAMHTEMWMHPATAANVAALTERGVVVVGPDEGELAGGDEGPGRLADEDDLVAAVTTLLTPSGPLAGRRVLVTAGGTREPIDPVRFIGNRSTGKMGFAVAAEAARRGAQVDLVAGPGGLSRPEGATVHQVETAREMHAAVMELAKGADVVVKAAAVADFRPATYASQKLKKHDDAPTAIALDRNPDILAELGADPATGPPGRILVGFAAETHDEEAHGREKLVRKNLDLVVVNRVDATDAGFGVDTNRALMLRRDGTSTDVDLTTKAGLAAMICDEVEALLAAAPTAATSPDTEPGAQP